MAPAARARQPTKTNEEDREPGDGAEQDRLSRGHSRLLEGAVFRLN
jgi:hypothetical protein